MQIHELNDFTGTLGSGAYLAIDNGTDTGKISSEGLLAATEARIDNIIAGPAPSAEEIVDARLGADGVTYPSLGDAIRDQFTDLKSDINYFANDILNNVINAVPFPYVSPNGYVNGNVTFTYSGRTLNISGTSNARATFAIYGSWGATNNLILDAGETYYLMADSDKDLRINFFNSSGTHLSGYNGSDPIVKVDVPSNATGMQILWQISNADIGKAYSRSTRPRLYKWTDLTGRTLSAMFSNSPITVTYGSDSTSIAIPSGTVVLTPQKLISSSYSGTLTLTNTNWLSYDATTDEFFLGVTRNGKKVYTVGLISHSSKKSFILGENVSEIKSSREWGQMFSNTLPTLEYTNSGCELTIPNNTVVLKKDGTTSVATGTTLTFTNANFISYDVDDGVYRVGQSYQTHRLVVLGAISTERYEASHINGVDIAIKRTIAFMGDSITAGSGTNKTYHQYIGERFGFTCLNYGYGGSGYVHNYNGTGGLVGQGNKGRGVEITNDTKFTPNNVLARLAEVSPAVDGIVIFAGTNDWADGGNISYANFIAGVDAVFDYVQTNFSDVPVLVMTPIHRKSDTVANVHTGKTLKDYADAIITECRKYGIPYVDTFGESGLHPDNNGNDTFYYTRDDTNVSDGLHPNHYAHERLMRCIANKLNEIATYQIKYMA